VCSSPRLVLSASVFCGSPIEGGHPDGLAEGSVFGVTWAIGLAVGVSADGECWADEESSVRVTPTREYGVDRRRDYCYRQRDFDLCRYRFSGR